MPVTPHPPCVSPALGEEGSSFLFSLISGVSPVLVWTLKADPETKTGVYAVYLGGGSGKQVGEGVGEGVRK